MSAVGRHSMKAILGLDEQDLTTLNAFDLILGLLTVLKVDTCQALELVFGRHAAKSVGEMSSLSAQACGQLCNGLS